MSATGNRWRTWVRRACIGVGCVAIVTCALVAAGFAWLTTEAGREYAKGRVEAFVSREIDGGLRIESIDSVTPFEVHGRGVHFTTKSGHDVLRADDVRLGVDWLELLRARIVITHAEVEGGLVVLQTTESGDITIDLAFASPNPSNRVYAPDDNVLRLERVHVRHVRVVGLVENKDFHMANVSANVSATVHRGGPSKLQARDIVGGAHLDLPMPLDFEVRGGALWFDGSNTLRAQLDLPAVLDENRVRFVIRLLDNERSLQIVARLIVANDEGLLASAPALIQGVIGDVFSDAIDFTVIIGDPNEPPALAARRRQQRRERRH